MDSNSVSSMILSAMDSLTGPDFADSNSISLTREDLGGILSITLASVLRRVASTLTHTTGGTGTSHLTDERRPPDRTQRELEEPDYTSQMPPSRIGLPEQVRHTEELMSLDKGKRRASRDMGRNSHSNGGLDNSLRPFHENQDLELSEMSASIDHSKREISTIKSRLSAAHERMSYYTSQMAEMRPQLAVTLKQRLKEVSHGSDEYRELVARLAVVESMGQGHHILPGLSTGNEALDDRSVATTESGGIHANLPQHDIPAPPSSPLPSEHENLQEAAPPYRGPFPDKQSLVSRESGLLDTGQGQMAQPKEEDRPNSPVTESVMSIPQDVASDYDKDSATKRRPFDRRPGKARKRGFLTRGLTGLVSKFRRKRKPPRDEGFEGSGISFIDDERDVEPYTLTGDSMPDDRESQQR